MFFKSDKNHEIRIYSYSMSFLWYIYSKLIYYNILKYQEYSIKYIYNISQISKPSLTLHTSSVTCSVASHKYQN